MYMYGPSCVDIHVLYYRGFGELKQMNQIFTDFQVFLEMTHVHQTVYTMPSFNLLTALAFQRTSCPLASFQVVSLAHV